MAESTLAEEVRSAYDYMPATLAGNVAGLLVILVLFWALAPHELLAAWGSLLAGLGGVRYALYRRFLRSTPRSVQAWSRWRRAWNAGTLAAGVLWGASAWLFYPEGDSIQRIGLIITIYTFCIAAVPVMATQPRLYMAFAALCFVPMVLRIAAPGDVDSYQLAGVLVLIFSLTTLLARNYRQALQRALDLKQRADELLVQLRHEKLAADQARREAEVANRAKTQFFAAASHDLRQPLHAMGLFAEALRSKVHDEEVAHLVNSINASVDALESLFSELLDISRIDAGGVAVQPQQVEVDDLLHKLRLHFEPVAFDKGLNLRLRGGRQVVHADPVLVERVLRNLVSNAIRYTDDGTVLVSARRRGDRVLLQVWDTGVGIAPTDQLRIFDEFYQVRPDPGSAARRSWDPAPGKGHQRTGLGLGLAIVKRLALLMGAPLDLRSVPSRGTVFTLSVPAGDAPAALTPAVVPPSAPAPLRSLAGRWVVVVEDEPAVRQGLEALLRGWEAQVLGFDSVAAVAAWCDGPDAACARPDLLIVDHGLEADRTGLEALDRLRARAGANVPAIVVTGSATHDLERAAQAGRFHVLAKPVVPHRLRALIAFKLGERTDGRTDVSAAERRGAPPPPHADPAG